MSNPSICGNKKHANLTVLLDAKTNRYQCLFCDIVGSADMDGALLWPELPHNAYLTNVLTTNTTGNNLIFEERFVRPRIRPTDEEVPF